MTAVTAVSSFGEERQGAARYMQALAQHWPFIVGTVVLAVLAAVVYVAMAEERYEAHADVLVTPVSPDNETFVGMPLIRESGQGRSVLTAARLVKAPQVADAVRERLGLGVPREELLGSVRVAPQEQSNIVTITAEAPTAQGAADVANAFAVAVIAKRTSVFQRDLRGVVQRLSKRLAALPEASRTVGEGRALADRLAALRGLVGSRDPTLQVASLAVPPTETSWPRPVLSVAAALLIGLLLGMGMAIALELVNPLVLRDEDVLEEGLALLGRVPRTPTREQLQPSLREGAAGGERVRDSYRLVRVNLSAARGNGDTPRTILVTSAARGEGKTTTAVNLALGYAQAGAHVLLVDADLRRARVARFLGIQSGDATLRELLLEEVDVEEAATAIPDFEGRLSIIGARPEDDRAVDLLQSRRIRAVVEDLAAQADVVILDSPPVTEVADALSLATVVDAVVLVVRFGRTRRDKLAEARLLLTQLGVLPAGVVAVTRRRARPSGGGVREGASVGRASATRARPSEPVP